ncbi:MAG: cytochrome c [Alphaproteobacteria bacterium]|nr:cytochrome c [Alphaproteobacteria bacterium]
MTLKRTVIAGLLTLAGLLALLRFCGTISLAHAAFAATTQPRTRFDAALIARGRALALVGNCASCHTAPNGATLAGGFALRTPFGVIYSDNITPDPEFGIGSWSEADFARAMRDGVTPDGEHLYPAFPYNYFARMTKSDLDALYAYLMTRRPVHMQAPANRLDFPFNLRVLLTGWNLLFLNPSPIAPRPDHTAAWNRGRYLVKSLAHCGACHTPRNWLQGEVADAGLEGGLAEGWTAPAINQKSLSPVPWTQRELETYLSTGIDAQHGAAAGPMRIVTDGLSAAPRSDVHAIAVYIASLMPRTPPRHAPFTHTQPLATAAAIVHGVCANCHGLNAPIAEGRWPSLAASTSLQETSPRNTIQILENGLPLPKTGAGPFMPGFANILSARQVAQVANYLREHVGGRKPWSDATDMARRIRAENQNAP